MNYSWVIIPRLLNTLAPKFLLASSVAKETSPATNAWSPKWVFVDEVRFFYIAGILLSVGGGITGMMNEDRS